MIRPAGYGGARRWAAALLLMAIVAPPLAAQELADPVQPRADARRIDRIADIFQAIKACWRPPAGSGFSGQEVTVRLSFKSTGEVLGQPRITYYKEGSEPELREPFTRAVREAFERCTPLPFTESLGRAVAGRVLSFRFVDTRPM